MQKYSRSHKFSFKRTFPQVRCICSASLAGLLPKPSQFVVNCITEIKMNMWNKTGMYTWWTKALCKCKGKFTHDFKRPVVTRAHIQTSQWEAFHMWSFWHIYRLRESSTNITAKEHAFCSIHKPRAPLLSQTAISAYTRNSIFVVNFGKLIVQVGIFPPPIIHFNWLFSIMNSNQARQH